jgi:glycosyltransferase involved in cell wall biosynthesis
MDSLPLREDMKILYICSADLSGETGSLGSVRHIMEVSGNLKKLGNQVKLIVPRYARYNQPTPVDIIYVPIIKLKFLRTFIYELLAPLFFLAYLTFWRPDIIYWRQAYLTFFPVFLSKLCGKIIITEVNGLTIDEVASETLNPLRKKIILRFEKFNYKYSSHLICVAPNIKERIIAHYNIEKDKVSVILNGVNSDRMPILNIKEAKKKIGIDPDVAVVGFVGHFFPWDGIEYLIEAADEIVKKKKDVLFLIIGHGRWGEHLQPLVDRKGLSKYFTFTGKVTWEQLYVYVNAFDVATAPYSMEINSQSGRSSLKILEYFACEKPVVASKTEVIPEIKDIDEMGLGITISPENHKALAAALLELLENDSLRKKMGRGGREYVSKKRSWMVVAEKTQAIVQTFVD